MDDLSAHYRFLMNMARAGVGQIAVMGTMHDVGYWDCLLYTSRCV